MGVVSHIKRRYHGLRLYVLQDAALHLYGDLRQPQCPREPWRAERPSEHNTRQDL